MISALQQIPPQSSSFKLVEVSVGLAAAAIVINTVLSWTLKWRRATRESNGNLNRDLFEQLYERPEFVLHAKKVDDVCAVIGKLEEAIQEQAKSASEILASSRRQEKLLEEINKTLRENENHRKMPL